MYIIYYSRSLNLPEAVNIVDCAMQRLLKNGLFSCILPYAWIIPPMEIRVNSLIILTIYWRFLLALNENISICVWYISQKVIKVINKQLYILSIRICGRSLLSAIRKINDQFLLNNEHRQAVGWLKCKVNNIIVCLFYFLALEKQILKKLGLQNREKTSRK